MDDRPFGQDVVSAVARHLNTDHRDDCLAIVRGVAGLRDASAASLADVDATAATFTAVVVLVHPETGAPVVVPSRG